MKKDNNPQKKTFFRAMLFSSLFLIIFVNIATLYFYDRQYSRFGYYFFAEISLIVLIYIIMYIFILKWHERQYKLSQSNRVLSEENEILAYEMQETGIQNEKMKLLIELSDIIQSCASIDEAKKAIEINCRKILHFAEGIFYVMNWKENVLEEVVLWGDPVQHENPIIKNQCWALKKGGIYQVKNPQTDLICQHIIKKTAVPYMCIPLIAQNSVLGLLHLDFFSDMNSLSAANSILISAVTETLRLALANIQLREKLREQSLHDSLTGLYNRRYLDEFILKEIHLAERDGMHIAIIMIDIDFFKQFNDLHGHDAGDKVLQEIAGLLQHEIRVNDIVCRYGGEEFLCILHDCDMENARNRAEELRNKTENMSLYYKDQKLESITISIGISIYPEDGASSEDLIHAADIALYHAKKLKRNTIVIYSELDKREE